MNPLLWAAVLRISSLNDEANNVKKCGRFGLTVARTMQYYNIKNLSKMSFLAELPPFT
jgi:hypothetical protein